MAHVCYIVLLLEIQNSIRESYFLYYRSPRVSFLEVRSTLLFLILIWFTLDQGYQVQFLFYYT